MDGAGNCSNAMTGWEVLRSGNPEHQRPVQESTMLEPDSPVAAKKALHAATKATVEQRFIPN